MTTPRDEITLIYHGRSHPAVRCGRHKHSTLYLLSMATSKAIVTPARKSTRAPIKAKGVVLHAGTSNGVCLTALSEIAWDGPGAAEAKRWAAEQCEIRARHRDNSAKSAERWALPSDQVEGERAKAKSYREMAASLRGELDSEVPVRELETEHLLALRIRGGTPRLLARSGTKSDVSLQASATATQKAADHWAEAVGVPPGDGLWMWDWAPAKPGRIDEVREIAGLVVAAGERIGSWRRLTADEALSFAAGQLPWGCDRG